MLNNFYGNENLKANNGKTKINFPFFLVCTYYGLQCNYSLELGHQNVNPARSETVVNNSACHPTVNKNYIKSNSCSQQNVH